MVVPETSINNIMGGLESTGGVTLHNHRRKLKQRFETIAKLGQGTYGKVQLGVNKETGQEVAIKTIKKCKIETEADLIRIRREIQIMSSLRHPYIIHIYEVFENRDKMVLVMEYAAGGELYDYLSKQKVLEESEARRIFRQIAMAVYYCHKHQICHRDLKLENILLDEQGNAKIADFGLSNVFDSNRLLSTFCGSPLYASPEIVKGIPYQGPEVDCWSLGVLLYTLVYGAMPFDGSNFKRLVRQISAGEYFEPKTPSSATELIAGLLTVKGTERLDITGVCQHPWMALEGKVSCYRLAVELAEEVPNRLDLLLALAPPDNQAPSVPEEDVSQPMDRPTRSQSLSSLPTMQPNFISTSVPQKVEVEEKESERPKEKERKRERSSSRSRRKEGEEDKDKPKKKSIKSKKKSDSDLPPKEDIEKLLDAASKISAEIAQESPKMDGTMVPESFELPSEPVAEPLNPPEEPPAPIPPQPEEKERPKDKEEIVKVKKIKKPKEVIKDDLKLSGDIVTPEKETAPKLKLKEELKKETPPLETVKPSPPPETPVKEEPDVIKEPIKEPEPIKLDIVRRKSKVFEAAEIFNKTSPTQEKAPQKKVFIPGVKVSDAKAAFERRSSIKQEVKPPEFNLASTVNVNKLVMNELNKDEEKLKKENAIKVISHAISESELNEKKASTLPRRKLSRPTPPRIEPEHMIANTSVSQIVYPTPPIPPPRPSLVKQDSGPREHIIPIQIERREETGERPQPVSKQASLASSRASTSSLGRQDSDSSTTATTCEPIRKSPREVIIPIAVEGGGFVTPSVSTLTKMSSVSESEEDLPMRGFGLHSTRRRHAQLETTDSLSSDEDDDNFEMLTAENLFSTLLSRMRHLTHRLDEGRTTFPRLFNPNLFDSPSRRLMETKSFSQNDPTPWRRKATTSTSSTLPRGFTTKSLRRLLSQEEDNKSQGRSDLPPMGRRKVTRTVSDSVQNGQQQQNEVKTEKKDTTNNLIDNLLDNGRLSSMERVKRYLEDLHKEEAMSTPSTFLRAADDQHHLGYDPARPKSPLSSRSAVSMNSNICDLTVGPSSSFTSRYLRPRTVYVPGSSQTSEFDRYINFKNSLEKERRTPLRRGPSLNAYDRIKELHEYRRSSSLLTENKLKEEPKEVNGSEFADEKPPSTSILEKYLYGDSKNKKPSRFLKKDKNESRVNKTIEALRRNSIGIENQFSESKLLKRAVSLEELNKEPKGRSKRSSSLKPEEAEKVFKKKESVKTKKGGVFETICKEGEKKKKKKQDEPTDLEGHQPQRQQTPMEEILKSSEDERLAKIANLKKLELTKAVVDIVSTDSTPTGDFDEAQSFISQTDNSDTWSSSDLTERYFDIVNAPEDCVSERIRRKSFYHRFNLPKRNTYHRSASNMERKRYF